MQNFAVSLINVWHWGQFLMLRLFEKYSQTITANHNHIIFHKNETILLGCNHTNIRLRGCQAISINIAPVTRLLSKGKTA